MTRAKHNHATIELYSNGTLDNQNIMAIYGGSTITVTGEGDASAIFSNEGWLGIYNGSALTVSADAEGTGTGQVNNSGTGELEVYDSGTIEIQAAATLSNAADASTSIHDEGDGSSLTIDSGGSLDNAGTLEVDSGGTLQIDGSLTNETDATITQTGGELNVSSSGELESAGSFDVSDGSVTNDGLVVLTSTDVSFIEALNSYGTNNATVVLAGADNTDISGLTLTGGTFNFYGDTTNNGGFTIGSDTTVVNFADLYWNDSSWTQYQKIEDEGVLVDGDIIETHQFSSDDLESFDSVFEAGGAGYGSGGNPFDAVVSLDDQAEMGSWALAPAQNTFSIAYNASAHTVTYVTGGQTVTESDVTWSDEGNDVLLLAAGTDGVNGVNNAAMLSNLVFTPTGGSAITLHENAAAGYTAAAASDTLEVGGLDLHDGFTLTGKVTMDYQVATTHPNVWVSMKAGTMPWVPIVAMAGSAHIIDPTNQPMNKTIKLGAAPSSGTAKVVVRYASSGDRDDDAELVVDYSTVPVGLYVTISSADGDGKRTVSVTQTISPGATGWHDLRIHVKNEPGVFADIRVQLN